MDFARKPGSGTNAGIRPNTAIFSDFGVFDQAEWSDQRSCCNLYILQDTVSAHSHIITQLHETFENTVDVYRHVAAAGKLAANVDTGWIGQGHALFQQSAGGFILINTLKRCQLRFAVDAQYFPDMIRLGSFHLDPIRDRHRHDVGEVILLLCIPVFQPGQPVVQMLIGNRHDAGINFANLPLGFAGILLFDNGGDLALPAATHDSAVAGGLVQFQRE